MAGRNDHLPYKDEAWFAPKRGPRVVELNEKQVAFIEHLVDPDGAKPTMLEWSKANDVPYRTVAGWKKNKLFREEWEKRAYEIHGGPERINMVVNKLYERATKDGDVRAMQLYLQYVDKFTPKREVVTSTKALEEMSNEELAKMGENIVALRGRSASNS